MTAMILNYYDFINEILNNDDYDDDDMLEEAYLNVPVDKKHKKAGRFQRDVINKISFEDASYKKFNGKNNDGGKAFIIKKDEDGNVITKNSNLVMFYTDIVIDDVFELNPMSNNDYNILKDFIEYKDDSGYNAVKAIINNSKKNPRLFFHWKDELYISQHDIEKPTDKNKIKNRGDVGELLFFLVTCYGFETLLQQPIDKKDIYEICKFLDEGNNEKYSEKIKIDKDRKEIIWTAPIVHNDADHPNDVLSGICVVTQSVIDALPKIILGEFDIEIDNCIEYFTNKYQSKIYELDNTDIEKIIICSLGPLDGDSKKEDCTIYIKTNNKNKKTNNTHVFSDDIKMVDKKINGKKRRIVKIENCDLDKWVVKNKENFSDVSKYSLKNNNVTVGQFSFGDIDKKNANSDDKNTLLTFIKDLKTFCCVYLKMGAKEDKDIVSSIINKSPQVRALYAKTNYTITDNSISNALYDSFLTKEGKIKSNLSKFLPLTANTFPGIMQISCETIADQIDRVYYRTNKEKHSLLYLLLLSSIALYDHKIQLFDMHFISSGFSVTQIAAIIRNYDRSILNDDEKLTIKPEGSYIKFIIKGKVITQIRTKYASNRIQFNIELTSALKNLLKP